MVETGTLIDNRYRVETRIGSGGMADVYLAEDTLLGRRVALKLLHHRFAEDQEFVERFKREAQSAAGLSHPNVVAVFDRGEWDGTYYIAMEYLSGRTLKQVIREHGALDPNDAIDIVMQILLAVRFAHRRGIIHRDIKPHNVILDEEGRAKVTDFGIARAGASDMTLTGSIMGTAQYLSPEQAQGHAVSAPSDLYAVGVVLYELLTGSVPFEGDSPVTIALKQVSEEPAPPSVRNPAVGPALDAVVMRALAKDPAQRYQSADELIVALGQARDGIAPEPTPNGAPTTVVPVPVGAAPVAAAAVADERERRRRRRWLWAAAGALLAAAVAIALLLALGQPVAHVTVPDVTGKSQAVAVEVLRRAGLDPKVSLAANARVASGLVIGETPPAGTIVEKGSSVNVVVSTGPGSQALADVTGKTSAEAEKILREDGFKPSVQGQASETVAKGLVISTDPTAGTEVLLGSNVTVLVSSGPAQVSVPDVTGESQAAASAALAAAGLKASVSQRETSEGKPGTVISQSPKGGTQAKPGSTVAIVVAQAPQRIAVPSVVGQTEEQAASTLTAQGFAYKTVSRAVTEASKNGVVLEQSPAAGANAAKGATVTLAVGKLTQQTTSTSTAAAPPTPPAAAPGPTPAAGGAPGG
jgi:eukaryotic-like serine/threonine-protein kinase